jgi:cysteine desulfuration protein SufE
VAVVNHSLSKLQPQAVIMSTLDEYVTSFELFDDWEQRYEYLVDIGEQLPHMPDELKTENNRVKACMSKVWIDISLDDAGLVHIQGDCDTSIIKGVLALLIDLCNGLTPGQVQSIDMDEIFQRLHLDSHLSPNRHVGVYAMFELIKQKAIAAQNPLQSA